MAVQEKTSGWRAMKCETSFYLYVIESGDESSADDEN